VDLVDVMNRTIRIVFSLTTLALIFLYGKTLPPSLLFRGTLFALGLVYMAILWFPEERWTLKKHVLSLCLVLAAVILLHFSPPPAAPAESLLLIPFILLLARERDERQRYLLVLAFISMAVMCILTPEVAFLVSVMPIVIALYMSVRAINIYKAAYRLSLQNLAELNAAHRELKRTHAALQESTIDSMRYAALAERTRLAQDIHDGLGHQLTSLIVQLQALEIMLPTEPSRAAALVPGMLGVARASMGEVHKAVKTWREEEGSDGLVALQGLISQSADHAAFQLSYTLDADGSNWPVALSAALYRILQEALTNILRHARASSVNVDLHEETDQVILTVSDDGCYTADRPLVPGYGLQGMQERCQAMGGSCQFSQNDLHGLKIKVILPLRSARMVSPNGPSEERSEQDE
jgi:signal transduction histidine kinase